MTKINNTELDHAKDLKVVMLAVMYNLTEYRDDYSKTSGGLCQFQSCSNFFD